MRNLKKLTREEIAQVSGGAVRMATFDFASRGGQPTGPTPFGGGMPGGPLMEPILKWCADHPGACTNIPPTQPRS